MTPVLHYLFSFQMQKKKKNASSSLFSPLVFSTSLISLLLHISSNESPFFSPFLMSPVFCSTLVAFTRIFPTPLYFPFCLYFYVPLSFLISFNFQFVSSLLLAFSCCLSCCPPQSFLPLLLYFPCFSYILFPNFLFLVHFSLSCCFISPFYLQSILLILSFPFLSLSRSLQHSFPFLHSRPLFTLLIILCLILLPLFSSLLLSSHHLSFLLSSSLFFFSSLFSCPPTLSPASSTLNNFSCAFF